MKKNLFVFLLVCFFILLNLNVSANPLPAPRSSGSVIPDDPLVDFISEEIIYVINKENEAKITAKYVFKNPNNVSCTQKILLPFEYMIPEDIAIYDGENVIDNYENIGMIESVISLNDEYFDYDYISFNVFFDAFETKEITARYTEKLSIPGSGDRFLSSDNKINYYIEYLAETGVYWNNSINATFIFKIKRDFYTKGLEGYNISYEGDYIVATKSFTNWVPNQNIKITWYNEDSSSMICCLIIIIVPILILIFFILFLVRLRKDTVNDYSSKYKKSNKTKKCPWCDKPVSKDYKICPSCGNQISDKYHDGL